jgi:hypothetical protein
MEIIWLRRLNTQKEKCLLMILSILTEFLRMLGSSILEDTNQHKNGTKIEDEKIYSMKISCIMER